MPEPNGRVEAMTSGLFFRCCALGYEANHYEGCELSPKEQYLKHADGRDEGLCGIDENSSDEAAHFNCQFIGLVIRLQFVTAEQWQTGFLVLIVSELYLPV